MTQVLQQPNIISKEIAFIDLKTQQQKIRAQIDLAIKRVLDHGAYIMGPEVLELEIELAQFCGVKHVISCANGTDALGLAIMALDVKPNDAVFVPSFTFASTAEVVAWVGATPVFVDCHKETYNIDPGSLSQGIETAKKAGLNPVGVIPVDVFGQPADYDSIQLIADTHKLWVLADAAQSFGATYKSRQVGSIGDIATTSFFPAKPLGCYGDGGAIFTDSTVLAETMKSMRVHGQGSDKYDNVRIGMNGRLDTIQAAVLLEKLKIFKDELNRRQEVADIYNKALRHVVDVPEVLKDLTSSWAQYTVVLPPELNRTELVRKLKSLGIPSAIYYVKPLHMQTAYRGYMTANNGALPVCEDLASRVLSLPMSGYLSIEDAQFIANSMRSLCEAKI